MHAIALELDQRLQSLDAETAAKCEQIVRDLLASLNPESTPGEPASNRDYKLPTVDLGGYQPGVDRTKLNHLGMGDDF